MKLSRSLLAGAAALAGLVTSVLVTGAPAAGALPSPSTDHPFSDPVWYPLQAEMWMNCAGGGSWSVNPGCGSHKPFFSIDEVDPKTYDHPLVFAMGAGIVHIITAHGASCPASPTSFGTSLYIDHGGGVVSRYGHFSSLLVSNGQRVVAGQRIGRIGTTGKGGNCSHSYLDYEVMHHGIKGTSAFIGTLKACKGSATTASTWPTALGYSAWNKVPMGGSPPKMIPAAGSHCLPTKAPATPNPPTGFTLSHGSGYVTVHWTRQSSARSVLVQWAATVSGRLPSPEKLHYTIVPGTASSTKISGLHNGTRYGFKVSFHNTVGYSRPTTTHTTVP